MVAITSLEGGRALEVEDAAISALAGPRRRDVGHHTYVFGATPAPLATAEPIESLLARLNPRPPFAKLTRPDGTPIWVRGASITAIRPPLDVERPDPPAVVKLGIAFGGAHQAIREDLDHARPILLAAGAKPALLA